MRILHVTRDFPPGSRGGISTAVGGLVRALRARGTSCAVVSFDDWRPRARAGATAPDPISGEEDGILVVRVVAPSQIQKAAASARDFAPTHVHVHHEMLWEFARQIRGPGPVVTFYTVHVLQAQLDALRGVERETLSARAQQLALQEADWVLAPSPVVERLLLLTGAALAPRLRVVGFGVDDSETARHSEARRAAAGYRSAGTPPQVLYVGRFADVNGTAELFELIAALALRLPHARFVVAGGVPGNRRAERRWLRRWAAMASADASQRTRFVGWVGSEDLARLYGEADVLVSPSWFETFGLTVLEAMLHGLPIAATRSGGVEQLLRNRGNALLSAPRDVDGLADNVGELLERPELARQLGSAAAVEARQRWLWPNVATQLETLYAQLEPLSSARWERLR